MSPRVMAPPGPPLRPRRAPAGAPAPRATRAASPRPRTPPPHGPLTRGHPPRAMRSRASRGRRPACRARARARDKRDAYLGTLVNAWLAEGGRASAVRAGEAYVDVGTLHGWHEALALLQA